MLLSVHEIADCYKNSVKKKKKKVEAADLTQAANTANKTSRNF